MNRLLILCILFFGSQAFQPGHHFKAEQLSYNRVSMAFETVWDSMSKRIWSKGIQLHQVEVHFRAYKMEQEFEVWVRRSGETKWNYFKRYRFCSFSGNLGPKKRQGDHQIPEGIYRIDRFNPTSNFHLSLGVNYPNKADSLRNGTHNLGGNIFIHGGCQTIGCIPLTDSGIEEVYTLAVQAVSNGQKHIPVHIFPCRMTVENSRYLQESAAPSTTKRFWKTLETGYAYFAVKNELPRHGLNLYGDYMFY